LSTAPRAGESTATTSSSPPAPPPAPLSATVTPRQQRLGRGDAHVRPSTFPARTGRILGPGRNGYLGGRTTSEEPRRLTRNDPCLSVTSGVRTHRNRGATGPATRQRRSSRDDAHRRPVWTEADRELAAVRRNRRPEPAATGYGPAESSIRGQVRATLAGALCGRPPARRHRKVARDPTHPGPGLSDTPVRVPMGAVTDAHPGWLTGVGLPDLRGPERRRVACPRSIAARATALPASAATSLRS